jgi:hypothetical protein
MSKPWGSRKNRQNGLTAETSFDKVFFRRKFGGKKGTILVFEN